MMEVSNVSSFCVKALLPSNFRKFNPFSLCCNGSALNIKELRRTSCLYNDGLKWLLCDSSSSWRQRIVLPTNGIKDGAELMRTPIRRPRRLSSIRACKATNEDDSRRPVSGESILLNKQTLEHKLQIAINEEDYAEAARIRDRILVLHEDSKASVLAANARFYNAFRTGDLATMQELWGKGENVCCVHPGASGISGYDLVMRSWEYVWVDYEFPMDIELKDAQVYVRGEVGYVNCIELVKTKGSSWGRQFATNVFERDEDGEWKMCIHHASPVDL